MHSRLIEKIASSGNNLHADVASIFRNDGWNVSISPYYYDDSGDKPREIDLIAKKHIEVVSEFGEHRYKDSFWIYLFIECKYLKHEVAFRSWLSEGEVRQNIKSSVITENFISKNKKIFSKFQNSFSVLKNGSIGLLYDTAASDERGAIFDMLTQPVKSLIFFKERLPKKAKRLYYALSIYEGIEGIYTIREGSRDKEKLSELQPIKNIITGLNYTYKNLSSGELDSQYFCVHFIHIDNITQFLEVINQDIQNVKNYFLEEYARIIHNKERVEKHKKRKEKLARRAERKAALLFNQKV